MSERKVFGPKVGSGAAPSSTGSSGRGGGGSDGGSSSGKAPSAGERRPGSGRKTADGSGGGKKEKQQKGDIDGAAGPKGDAGKAKQTQPAPPNIEGTVYASLPKLKDTTDPEAQQELFVQKLRECCTIYDFKLPETNLPEKEGKRQTLVELVDFANASKGQLFTKEENVRELLSTIGANAFRTLTKRERTPIDMLDGADEEEPTLEPAWPHLELVYELLQRIVSSKELDSSVAQKCFNKRFMQKLLELFDSDDPREREVLKTVVNRVYAKISSLRAFLRREIQNLCMKSIVEKEVQNGIAELLEILNRVINGFSTPLKPENRDMFFKLVIPLHKVDWLCMYHSQLMEGTKKFVEKDGKLAFEIVAALLRYWPYSVSSKQILYLSEIEEFIFTMPAADIKRLQEPLGRRLAECVSFPNSDVAEKTLQLWKSDKFVKLLLQNCRDQFPSIISSLYDNATQHWQGSVHTRTFEILKLLMEKDPELFDSCSAKHRKQVEEVERKGAIREKKWAILQEMHDRKVAQANARAGKPAPPVRSATGVESKTSALGRSDTGDAARGRSHLGGNESVHGTQVSSRSLANGSRGNLTNGDAVQAGGGWRALPNERYGACVSWEGGDGKPEAEVSLQVLMVDSRGRVVGAVHEHNRVAMQAFVHCEGDRPIFLSGSAAHCGGIVWLNLARAPDQVAMLLLVVSAAPGGRLSEVANCTVHVVEEATDLEVMALRVEQPKGDVGVTAVVKRCPKQGWSLSRVDDFGKSGHHFMDVLDHGVGKAVREALAVPKKQKFSVAIAFSNLAKGDVVCLPNGPSCRWLFLGVSWDMLPSVVAANDNSAVNIALLFFDAQGELLGSCHRGSPEAMGARHGGGGLLGQGAMLDLNAVPVPVEQIFVVGHFSSERLAASDGIQKLQCCIVDPLGAELVRFSLERKASIDLGFVAGRLLRGSASNSAAQRWNFQALASPLSGATWDDSLDDTRAVFEMAMRELQPLPSDLPSTGRCLVCL